MTAGHEITNPKYIGSGTWYVIHLTASKATTEESKKEFLNMMNLLKDHFSCMDCRDHIRKYILANPIKKYWNVKNEEGRPIGMFKWSYNFHHAVNRRINKQGISWEVACDLYINDGGVCASNCGIGEISHTPIEEGEEKDEEKFEKKFEIIRVAPTTVLKRASKAKRINMTSL